MDARECMLTRRSVRKYKEEPLSDELLQRILEPALMAPSAVNLQHWHFVVLRSPAALCSFKSVMQRALPDINQYLTSRFGNHPEVVRETSHFIATLGNAPVCVLAFFMKESFNENYSAYQSVGAAIENLLLSAWSEGVATCWMSPDFSEELKAEIQTTYAPGKGKFVAAISMGRPDQTPKMPARREGRYTFL